MKTRSLSALLCTVLLTSTAALHGANSSTIRSPLTNTGVDDDASGNVLAVLQTKQSLFSVELAGLTAGQQYRFSVGDVVETQFVPDARGRARLRFATAAQRNRLLLDFDPRNKTVAVVDASAAVVLQAVISGQGEPTGTVVDERANLSPVDAATGRGNARFVADKKGRRELQVAVKGLAGTGFHLFVNGIDRGEVPLRRGSGRMFFRSEARPGEDALTFEPRAALIDIMDAAGVIHLSGKLEARARGVNFATRSTRTSAIPSTGADPDAHAEAKLRTNADATRDFSVEIEDVAEGSYELLVDGVLRGSIVVTARVEGGTQGEIEFSNEVDDHPHELPLNFDPVGANLTIRQDATIFFEGLFNPAASIPGRPAPGIIETIHETLASTGLDPDASATAELASQTNGELEFEVEVEDVDPGQYAFIVGGIQRGVINAQLLDGRVRGKLKFEAGDDRARSAVRHGADDPVADDRGGLAGGNGADDPIGDDRGGLTGGSGADDPATADQGGGGASSGGDTTPRLPLQFDPRGQLIEIKNSAGTFFSHVFGDGSAAPGAGGTGGTTVPGIITVALFSSGADDNATAKAEFKRDDRGGESFEVEVEDVSPGAFELLVGGAVRGTLQVDATDRGTRGKIEFDDEPAAGEQLLDFDPLGQLITIRKDGIVYFERTFPSGS